MNKRILSVIVFGAALLSVQAQDGKGGISPAMLGQIQQSYQGTPSDKALRNAIGNNDIRKLALNQENMQDMDTHFSIKVDSKGITDQKSSGRCWLFTGLNVMRAKVLARYGFPAFEFSEIYNPQIQISAESETKRSIFREKDKTKRSKKESAQHSKSRNKSFVMTSVSAL